MSVHRKLEERNEKSGRGGRRGCQEQSRDQRESGKKRVTSGNIRSFARVSTDGFTSLRNQAAASHSYQLRAKAKAHTAKTFHQFWSSFSSSAMGFWSCNSYRRTTHSESQFSLLSLHSLSLLRIRSADHRSLRQTQRFMHGMQSFSFPLLLLLLCA